MTKENDETPKHFHFTNNRIENIQPPVRAKQVYYNDTEARGLEISVSKGGTKQYFYRRKVNGITLRLKLGYFPDIKLERARARVGELNAMVANGGNPFDQAQAARKELTLEGLFNEYLNKHATDKRQTADVMPKEFALRAGKLKDKQVSAITPDHAATLHADLTSERGPYAANRTVQLIRAVYNFGLRTKIISGDNPFTGITLNPEKPRERFLTDAEVAKIFKVIDELPGDDGATVRAFVYIALFTGARKTNIFEMEWSQIDEEEETWTIPETKNDTRQVVALGPTELAILDARKKALTAKAEKEGLEPSNFVCPGTGVSGHMVDIKKSWATVRKIAKIEDVTIHDLRRSLGSGMANSNINLALVKGVMNHKDLATTAKHYAFTGKEAQRAAKDVVHQRWAVAAEKAAAAAARKAELEEERLLMRRKR